MRRVIVYGFVALAVISLALAIVLQVVPGSAAYGRTPTPEGSRTPTTTVVVPTPSSQATLATGRGLDWQRQDGTACGQLVIDDKAQPSFAPCSQALEVAAFEADELRTYLVYTARFAPFLYETSGQVSVRLDFRGRGTRVASASEQAEVADWVASVYDRLSGEQQQADVVARVRTLLARRLGISADEIETRSVQAVTWPNACLDVLTPGLDCPRVSTPGYRIVLAVGSELYEYRTDLHDKVYTLEAPLTATPVPATPTPTSILPTATPSPTPQPTSPVYITDWKGEYYGNPTLSGTPQLVRNDLAVSFDWGQGAPAAGLPADNYSVRWSRRLRFLDSWYVFRLRGDDGVRLWVDGQLIIDRWQAGWSDDTVQLYLWAGEHDLVVAYYELQGQAQVELTVERLASTSTPTATPVITEWRAEYFTGRDLAGSPLLVRNEHEIDFDWGNGSPATSVPADNFSARFTRGLDFAAGVYRFTATVDDGVRLYVDGQLLIDEWHTSARRQYQREIALSGAHTLRVEYFEQGGVASLALSWTRLAPTATPTASATARPTATSTATSTPTATASPSPTASPTVTATASTTPNATATSTASPSPTATATSMASATATPTLTATVTETPTEPAGSTTPTATPTATAEPAAGWQATYYNNTRLWGEPALSQNEPELGLDWGLRSPGLGVNANYFSARFERQVTLPAGSYRLHLLADDGARVYIDGELVLNGWLSSRGQELTRSLDLSGTHLFRVEYYDRLGSAALHLDIELITPPWDASYYDNLELAGDPLLQRAEAGPNLSWDEGNAAQTPAPPPQTLAARYVQSVVLPAGSYRLRATTNAGVRLYVDDQLLLDAWDAAANAAVGNMATLQRTYTTAVLAGGAHTVRLEVRRVAPDVSLQVFWEPIL